MFDLDSSETDAEVWIVLFAAIRQEIRVSLANLLQMQLRDFDV